MTEHRHAQAAALGFCQPLSLGRCAALLLNHLPAPWLA